MQTLDPSKAVWPVVEEIEVHAAGEGEIAFVADPIADSDIVAEYDVDVVVCGLGPAGDAAALACAEAGLNVVAVEKRDHGNYNSATIGGTDSKVHKHWGMTFDKDAWLADAIIDSAFQGDITLYKHWLESNGEAVDWYLSHFDNQNLDDYPLTFAAGDFPDFRDEYDKTSYSRSWNTSINLPYDPTKLAEILAGFITEAGAEIRYNTPACQLVTDDEGAVIGVIVKNENGEYEKYNTAKGVVLATGGYEFNEQMLRERCRPRGIPGHWLTGSQGNTGDGHQMGLAVGAAEDDFPQAIMLDPEQLMPYLRVNKLGKRFTAEYEPYGHLAMAIQAQPGTYDFYIVDGAIDTKIDKIWTPSSSCYGPKEVWTGAATKTELVADTLEELAQMMEVPEDEFVATIEHWNEMAAAGKDSDYNFPGEMMMTIDTPPYYATREYADGLCTAGGLIVNTECQVLDRDRQPIEGLYAAGLTSGGMFYNTYPHNLNCLSHTRNCEMGYTIGKVLGDK